jgi:hypothetical protein
MTLQLTTCTPMSTALATSGRGLTHRRARHPADVDPRRVTHDSTRPKAADLDVMRPIDPTQLVQRLPDEHASSDHIKPESR